MLMRNTSAPALNSLPIMAALEEAGPRVATILARRNRLMSCVSSSAVVGWRRGRRDARLPRGARRAGLQRPVGGLLGAVGQLHRPGALLAGVDFEEPGAVIAARQAVFGAANGELLLT